MTNPVVWFEVLGNDAGKLQQFYRQLFNWKLDTSSPSKYATVEAGERSIPGGVGAAGGPRGGGVTFFVESPDLAASLAQAEKLGGRVVVPPTDIPDGPKIAYFADPEGHIVGLVAPMPA